MYFSIWGFCFCLCFGVHYVVPFLVLNHLEEEERAGSFAFIVLRISCYCKCSVAFPHDVVSWSGVYDCCIS